MTIFAAFSFLGLIFFSCKNKEFYQNGNFDIFMRNELLSVLYKEINAFFVGIHIGQTGQCSGRKSKKRGI